MAEQKSDIGDMSQTPVQTRRETPEVDSYEAFIDELRDQVHRWADPQEAARAVLCTLAQRLSGGERESLESELPDSIVALMRGGCPTHPGRAKMRRLTREEFIQDVADHLRLERSAAEPVVRAVFTAIRDRVPEDEVHKVASQLPAELADLFRKPV